MDLIEVSSNSLFWNMMVSFIFHVQWISICYTNLRLESPKWTCAFLLSFQEFLAVQTQKTFSFLVRDFCFGMAIMKTIRLSQHRLSYFLFFTRFALKESPAFALPIKIEFRAFLSTKRTIFDSTNRAV